MILFADSDCTDTQADYGLHCLHMPEDTSNIFYSHSLPSADSRREVVSFWQKNVHNIG